MAIIAKGLGIAITSASNIANLFKPDVVTVYNDSNEIA